jgi:phosphoribosylglycinamide formyltransferase-1
VLISGSGTLLQNLIDQADAHYEVVAVGSDKAGVAGLDRAERAGIPHFVAQYRSRAERDAWETELIGLVEKYQPDFVVSAGFMKILSQKFLDKFPNRVINTHPALLPAFPGAHAVRDTLAYGAQVTGSTVHLVDAGVDTGPILAQRPVPVHHLDSEEELHERIKKIERELLVDVIIALVRNGFTLEGRKVIFP